MRDYSRNAQLVILDLNLDLDMNTNNFDNQKKGNNVEWKQADDIATPPPSKKK